MEANSGYSGKNQQMEMYTTKGGFPSAIFRSETRSEPFHCLICLDVCRSPVTCQSGAHLFCLNCLATSLRESPTCPVCRDPLSSPLPSAFASAQVSALDVVCVHEKCKWKGTCGRLDGHLDTDCAHQPVRCSGEGGCGKLVPRGEMESHQSCDCLQSCPNNAQGNVNMQDQGDGNGFTCDVRVSRKDLDDHLQNHCKLRLLRCPHPPCVVFARAHRMPAHAEVCPHAPMSCPRQCGALHLTRQSLDAHAASCLCESVPCVHSLLGCTHVAPRDQMRQHEDDVRVHFAALSKMFVEQKQLYERLQQLHQQLQHSHDLLVHRMQQTEEKVLQSHQQLQHSHDQQARQMQEMEEKLRVQTALLEGLQAQSTMHGEDLRYLQPVVAKVRGKAESTKARGEAEGKADEIMRRLQCWKCTRMATLYFQNDLEPERNDVNRIHGISGTCSQFTHVFSCRGQWGGTGLQSRAELVEHILNR